MPGAQRTRSLVRKNKKHTSIVTTGSPKHSGIPCTMALRLIPRSLRRSGFLSPSLAKGFPQTSRQRRGVKTTRLRRMRDSVSSGAKTPDAARIHRIPRSTCRDGRDTPLFMERETREGLPVICPTTEAKFFSERDWTFWGTQFRADLRVLANESVLPSRWGAHLRASWTMRPGSCHSSFETPLARLSGRGSHTAGLANDPIAQSARRHSIGSSCSSLSFNRRRNFSRDSVLRFHQIAKLSG
jgi:hypothetical protein